MTRSATKAHSVTTGTSAQDGSSSQMTNNPTQDPIRELAAEIPQASDSTEEVCECAFCFESYCQDGQEWVMCACGRWVHEQCLEEIICDANGEERFCPFCLNK